MHSKEMFFEKFKEAAASVLPITLIVALMCFSFIPVTPDLLLAFLLLQGCANGSADTLPSGWSGDWVLLGNFLGAELALKQGAKITKPVILVVLSLLALKILGII